MAHMSELGRILVFDDLPANLRLISRWLRADHFEVRTSDDPAALTAELEQASGQKVYPLSAAGEIGIEPVLDALLDRLHAEQVEDDGPADEIEWSPL